MDRTGLELNFFLCLCKSRTVHTVILISYTFTESRERSEMEAAFEKKLDPIAGSPATGKSVTGIINLFVNDFLQQVEKKWNNEFWPDLENIFKLVQKIGMM